MIPLDETKDTLNPDKKTDFAMSSFYNDDSIKPFERSIRNKPLNLPSINKNAPSITYKISNTDRNKVVERNQAKYFLNKKDAINGDELMLPSLHNESNLMKNYTYITPRHESVKGKKHATIKFKSPNEKSVYSGTMGKLK